MVAYSNQIVKPNKKKINPKLTMNMAGLSGHQSGHHVSLHGHGPHAHSGFIGGG